MIVLPVLQEHTKLIKTTCPICEKIETITIPLRELKQAQKNHALITKAIPHTENGHVLTVYIDGEGIVRRKYCFDLIQNNIIRIEDLALGNLDSIFDKMLRNSLREDESDFNS